MSYYLHDNRIEVVKLTPTKLFNRLIYRESTGSVKPLHSYDKWVKERLQALLDSPHVMFKGRLNRDVTNYLPTMTGNSLRLGGGVALINAPDAVEAMAAKGMTMFIKKIQLHSFDAFAVEFLTLDNNKLSGLHRKLIIDEIIESI